MELLLILLFVLLLTAAERFLFRRFWQKGFFYRAAFQTENAVEGDLVEMEETIVNQKLLPLPTLVCEITLDENRHIHRTKSTVLCETFSLRPYHKITRRIRLSDLRRGFYELLPTELSCYDALLGRELTARVFTPSSLYVYPAPYPSTLLQPAFSRLTEAFQTRFSLCTDPYAFRGLRAYAPGDSMKQINWKASARGEELRVNLFEYTAYLECVILLDLESCHARDEQELQEWSLRIANAVAAECVRRGYRLSFRSNGCDCLTGKRATVPTDGGTRQYDAVRKTLARLYARIGVPGIDTVLADERPKDGTFYFLISAALGPTARETAEVLAQRGGYGAVLVPFTNKQPELPNLRVFSVFPLHCEGAEDPAKTEVVA